MTNPIEEKINRVARSVEPSAEFSQKLWNEIKMKPHTVKEPKRISRRFWIPAVTVLGVMVILVVSAPQTVLAAFRSLLSYIPGIGFVQTSETTLYLTEPVVTEKDGYSFTIDQVVADAEKVVVSYHIDSLTSDTTSCFYDGNRLLLPDGSSKMPIGGGVQGSEASVEFSALPEGVKEASIIASMDIPSEDCAGPQEWIVPFALGSEAPVENILPVIENTVTQAPVDLPTDGSTILFNVDKYVELSDGYLLTGHMISANSEWRNTIIDMETITARDANGMNVPVEPTDDSFGDKEFSFKVASKEFTGPVTFNIKGIWVWANMEKAPSFSFDAGSDPQTGQSWMVNQDLTIAGKKITVQDVQMIADDSQTNVPGTLYGYSIHILAEGMNNVGFNCSGEQGPSSLFGQTLPLNANEQISENYYPEGIPTGLITCKLQDAQFKENGDWQFTWQPISVSE